LVASELAGARAMQQGYDIWDRVMAYFVEYPELREYFYEGLELPEDSRTRARVLAVAELMADALQSNYWLFQGKDVELLVSVDPVRESFGMQRASIRATRTSEGRSRTRSRHADGSREVS
jgi:hypothetical protein